MKVKKLKELLEKVDDDFDINLIIYKKIPEQKLKNIPYPYPYNQEKVEIEFDDIGYTSKIIKFSGEIKEI